MDAVHALLWLAYVIADIIIEDSYLFLLGYLRLVRQFQRIELSFDSPTSQYPQISLFFWVFFEVLSEEYNEFKANTHTEKRAWVTLSMTVLHKGNLGDEGALFFLNRKK